MGMPMRQERTYVPPQVKHQARLMLEEPILENSFVDKAEINSIGQEVEDYNFGDSGFNHVWE